MKNLNKLFFSYGLGFLAGLLLGGCALESRVSLQKGYDFSRINSIGVAAFSSTQDSSQSGTMVRDEFVRQLMKKNLKIKELPAKDSGELVKLASQQQLDVVLVGSVNQYVPDRRYLVLLGKDAGTGANSVVVNNPLITEIAGSSAHTDFPVMGMENESKIVVTNAVANISVKIIDVKTESIVWINSSVYEGLDIQAAVEGGVSYLLKSFPR